MLRGLEPSVQIQGQHRRRQRDDQGARDSEQELEHAALRRRRPVSEQLPHVRDLPGPRSRLREPGGGREGPPAQSRRRREPRHHADARAKYGGHARIVSRRRHMPQRARRQDLRDVLSRGQCYVSWVSLYWQNIRPVGLCHWRLTM